MENSLNLKRIVDLELPGKWKAMLLFYFCLSLSSGFRATGSVPRFQPHLLCQPDDLHGIHDQHRQVPAPIHAQSHHSSGDAPGQPAPHPGQKPGQLCQETLEEPAAGSFKTQGLATDAFFCC